MVEEKIRHGQFQAESEELKIDVFFNSVPRIVEAPITSDEERKEYEDKIIKTFRNSPHELQLKENRNSVSRETYKFSKELLDQRYTSINVNAALHALEHGQSPYVLIEQLLQQLDNIQEEHRKFIELHFSKEL